MHASKVKSWFPKINNLNISKVKKHNSKFNLELTLHIIYFKLTYHINSQHITSYFTILFELMKLQNMSTTLSIGLLKYV